MEGAPRPLQGWKMLEDSPRCGSEVLGILTVVMEEYSW